MDDETTTGVGAPDMDAPAEEAPETSEEAPSAAPEEEMPA